MAGRAAARAHSSSHLSTRRQVSRCSPPGVTVPTSSNTPLCWTVLGASCFEVSELFSTDDQIASLAITHDGRVMLVENGRRIRVLADNAIRSEPAFQVERATDRIVDIAIDPHFGDTGTVYVAWVEEGVATRRTLTVSRFREVPRTSWAKALRSCQVCRCRTKATRYIAVDDERRIYVALPQNRETRADGHVLRLTDQGTVPGTPDNVRRRLCQAWVYQPLSRPSHQVVDCGLPGSAGINPS